MLKKWFKEYWFTFLVLLVITVIAYGQTLWMYFLVDDNALIYKLQHLNTYSGFWGKGLFGEGPYRHIIDQFVLFYPLFKVNPTPYFAVGVFLYFLSSASLYLFAKSITKNELVSFAAAGIFASGYVGSESMFGITNSWQTTRGIIMALGVLWLFYKFKTSGKFVFYALSVILFFFSLDTVYIRAHGLIFAIFFFDIIFWPVILKISSLLKLILRQMPFLAIYYYIYLSSYAMVKRLGVLHFLSDVFIDGKLVLVTVPVQDIGSLFIPDSITSHIDRAILQSFTIPAGLSVGPFAAGVCIIVIFIKLIVKNIRDERFLKRVLIFSAIFAVANFFTFWLREPTHTLWTTHRYFLYSFVGVSLFWSISFYLIIRQLQQKEIFKTLTVGVILIYLWLGINYQYSFNLSRSFPARKFFSSFKEFVTKIPKDSVIYFDLANDSQIKGEFGSFFGGMFSEAGNLAILSDVEDYTSDFLVTYKMDDVKELLKEGKTSLNRVFTFYYGENGLVNTTDSVRQLLTNPKVVNIEVGDLFSTMPFEVRAGSFKTKTQILFIENKSLGSNPVVTIKATPAASSLFPSKIKFLMLVKPIFPPLPYESEGDLIDISADEKSRVFAYIDSQSSFRETAIASSGSFWKEQEPKFAIDGRLETSWRGHRGFWDNIDRGITHDVEHLSVDLGRTLTVGQVSWVSAQRPLVPMHYKILTSLNGKLWDLVKEVTDGKALSEETVVVDSFNPTPVRFVKMEILITYGNDGPEIKEFEVIESQFTDLDRRVVEKVRQAPFGKIETLSDFNNALAFVRQNATLRFYFMSSADAKQDPTRYIDIPLFVDGNWHEYQVDLPATGLSWTQFTLEGFNFPAQIVIEDVRLTFHSIGN